MSDTLIKVENIHKKFTRDLRKSLVYGTKDTLYSMLGKSYSTGHLRKKEFWALENINFELKRGEVLGLIGKNGCGKSTLLRVISGIIPPDKGKITIRGNIGALIAVGAGFHPHMSGRENIYLNGTLLGMNKSEITRRFDEIVQFSEIDQFLEAPVATYSSGMRVRLGFAIAIHTKPDILLIDEVLAVGDIGFRIKSLNKINELLDKAAIIFVSHSMSDVSRICNKVMLLKDSKVEYYGDTRIGIDKYYSLFSDINSKINKENINFKNFTLNKNNSKTKTIINYNSSLNIEFDYICTDNTKLGYNIAIHNKEKKYLLLYSKTILQEFETNKKYHFNIDLGKIPLISNEYNISIEIYKESFTTITKNIILNYESYFIFKVINSPIIRNISILLDSKVYIN